MLGTKGDWTKKDKSFIKQHEPRVQTFASDHTSLVLFQWTTKEVWCCVHWWLRYGNPSDSLVSVFRISGESTVRLTGVAVAKAPPLATTKINPECGEISDPFISIRSLCSPPNVTGSTNTVWFVQQVSIFHEFVVVSLSTLQTAGGAILGAPTLHTIAPRYSARRNVYKMDGQVK